MINKYFALGLIFGTALFLWVDSNSACWMMMATGFLYDAIKKD